MQAEAKQCHKKFKECGQKSLHVLDNNIRNVRYPGFSEFFSSNVLLDIQFKDLAIGEIPGSILEKGTLPLTDIIFLLYSI